MSGGGSGGGGAGRVDYPSYMKTWHEDGLGTWGAMNDVSTLMATAIGSSPYATASAYDPSPQVDDMTIAASNTLTEVESLTTTAITEQIAKIDAMDTVGEQVDFETDIYPRFERGMQNINAVQSTAFVQGKSNLDATYAARLVTTKIELRNRAVELLDRHNMEYSKLYIQASGAVIETARMAIVAYSEQNTEDLRIEKADTLWDLEMVKYGGNFLGSIGGTAIRQGGEEPSQVQSALGGAMSGAAAGGMVAGASGGAIAGPVGAIAGGLLGIGASLL